MFEDIVTSFRQQLSTRKVICHLDKMSEEEKDNIIKAIINVIEYDNNNDFVFLKKIIDNRKEMLIKKKEEIDCNKYYCDFISYYEIILLLYEKYNKFNLKGDLKRFKGNLVKFLDKEIKRFIRLNRQILIVEQFVKIKEGSPDIDINIIRKWGTYMLDKLGRSKINVNDVINELVVVVINKLDIDNRQIMYKSIYSYLEYYFRYALSLVNKRQYIVDVPVEILNTSLEKKINSKGISKQMKIKVNLFKKIYNEKERRLDFSSSLDNNKFSKGFPDDTINETINKLEVDAYLQLLKNTIGSKYAYIIEQNFLYGKTYKEIGKALGISQERVRQLKERALNLIKKVLKK